MGSEELYGVGASTYGRSGQVKVANLQLSPASRQHQSGSLADLVLLRISIQCPVPVKMDDLYDEYACFNSSFFALLIQDQVR